MLVCVVMEVMLGKKCIFLDVKPSTSVLASSKGIIHISIDSSFRATIPVHRRFHVKAEADGIVAYVKVIRVKPSVLLKSFVRKPTGSLAGG